MSVLEANAHVPVPDHFLKKIREAKEKTSFGVQASQSKLFRGSVEKPSLLLDTWKEN